MPLTEQLESDESLPEYLNWILKSKGLKVVKMEKPDEKIEPITEPRNILKSRELEQTQELLMNLTNELFNKIEKLEKKEKIKNKKVNTEEKSQKKESQKKEPTKFVFSDISWYKEKLYNAKK